MSVNSCSGWLCVAVSVAVLTAGAYADELLVVDLTIENQITITATDGLSAVTRSGPDGRGVYFEDFYGSEGSLIGDTLVAGDLTNAENPSDLSPNLFRAQGGTDPGLNLFSWSSDDDVTFTADSLAWVGSATWDLDPPDYAVMLGGATSGNLYFPASGVGESTFAELIGTYTVIPEPASFGLFAMGALVAAWRRR